jgi:hypothetical protein
MEQNRFQFVASIRERIDTGSFRSSRSLRDSQGCWPASRSESGRINWAAGDQQLRAPLGRTIETA